MNKREKQKMVITELIADYKKARDKRDFVSMREIYTELWKRDNDIFFPDEGRNEIVFFAEILDDNSMVLPSELSELFGKKCYISLFEEHLNITIDIGYESLAEYLKESSLKFKKSVLQKKLEISSSALSKLEVKSGDILRIEFAQDEFDTELNIYSEANDWRFNLPADNIAPQKGYNIYQARLYTITDQLAAKKTFIDKKEAEDYSLGYFKDEQDGALIARAVIRTIDPLCSAWLAVWSVDNPNAILCNEDSTSIVSWRINYYDKSDIQIETEYFTTPVSKMYIIANMIKKNVFYVTVSCCENGHTRSIISKTYRNKFFNLFLTVDEDTIARINNTNIPLEEKYKSLIEQDMEETDRINRLREQNISDSEQ